MVPGGEMREYPHGKVCVSCHEQRQDNGLAGHLWNLGVAMSRAHSNPPHPMKHLRTSVSITVASYLGDDVGPDGALPNRPADVVVQFTMTRTNGVPADGNAGAIAADQIESLLESANTHLGAQLAHQLRKS